MVGCVLGALLAMDLQPFAIDRLTFTDISEEEIDSLGNAHEVARVRALLSLMMGVPVSQGAEWTSEKDSAIFGKEPEPLWDIMIDEYFFAFNWCKEQGLTKEVTSTFMSILKRVIMTGID